MAPTRSNQKPQERAAHHRARIIELLEQVREKAERQAGDECDWGDVGELAEIATTLAELVPCDDCDGTGYASGRAPRREVCNEEHPSCETCGGSGHERA